MLSDEHLARRSKSQFEQMKSKEPVSSNRNDQAMIEEIGKRIAGVAQVDLLARNGIRGIPKNEPNAFAMPGGKVGVNSGLIELAGGNEDEIAAVMGHEIAHAISAQQQTNVTSNGNCIRWGNPEYCYAGQEFHGSNDRRWSI